MRTTGPLATIAATALVFSLAGCSGSGGGELSYEDSPLSKYLMASTGSELSPEEQQKQADEQQRKQEELVAQCMSREGFEYTPNTDNGSTIVTSGGDFEWEPEKREWVEKYGYGMVNSPWNEQQQEEGPAEEYTDPNQGYIDSLSPSEQTAYWETLYGGPTETEGDGSEEGGSFEYRWQDAGCQGWAQNELQGSDPWQDEQFAGLRQKMNDLWTKSQDSAELSALDGAWADAGEPGFAKQAEAPQSISDAQNKIYETAYGDGTTEIDPESPEVADPSSSPEMKALGEREIALALKDLDCREKTSYRQEALKAQFALEERFIAENKAELEAFKAAAEQSS